MFRRDDPPLNPDAPTARRWLREELSKPEYREHKSLIERILEWLSSHLGGSSVGGTGIPWWVIAGLLLFGVILLLVLAGRRHAPSITRRSGKEPPQAAIFDPDGRQDAQDYRALAEAALSTDPDMALLAAYRAVVARAHEGGLVHLIPATTVGDINDALGAARPEFHTDVHDAGSAFAAVRYGTHHASQAQAQAVLHLDDRLAESVPTTRPTDRPKQRSQAQGVI